MLGARSPDRFENPAPGRPGKSMVCPLHEWNFTNRSFECLEFLFHQLPPYDQLTKAAKAVLRHPAVSLVKLSSPPRRAGHGASSLWCPTVHATPAETHILVVKTTNSCSPHSPFLSSPRAELKTHLFPGALYPKQRRIPWRTLRGSVSRSPCSPSPSQRTAHRALPLWRPVACYTMGCLECKFPPGDMPLFQVRKFSPPIPRATRFDPLFPVPFKTRARGTKRRYCGHRADWDGKLKDTRTSAFAGTVAPSAPFCSLEGSSQRRNWGAGSTAV